MNKKKPQRMCVCCREMKDKNNLLRIVLNKESQMFVDETGKANGRGAYICTDIDCLAKLKKQKVLNKIFKKNIEETFYQEVEDAITRKS